MRMPRVQETPITREGCRREPFNGPTRRAAISLDRARRAANAVRSTTSNSTTARKGL